MPKEIERKFLVRGDSWRASAKPGVPYRQGYLPTEAGCTVRVRTAGGEAYLTVKGTPQGASRDEYEYAIPYGDAQEMLDRLCIRPLIEKRRYEVDAGGLTWVIDEFEGENAGLIVAELELEDEGQGFSIPDWAGPEVTSDPRYTNRSLVSHPYRDWGRQGGA